MAACLTVNRTGVVSVSYASPDRCTSAPRGAIFAGQALCRRPAIVRNCSSTVGLKPVVARFGEESGKGGTGVLERPKFDQSSEASGPSTESGYGSQDTDKRKRLGGGNYRLLLLDSNNHTEKLVVKVVTSVVPGVDAQHAKNCFHTAKELGMAIVCTCLKEHAEFYAQQLFRNGCRASIEPDYSTI